MVEQTKDGNTNFGSEEPLQHGLLKTVVLTLRPWLGPCGYGPRR